jgi:hypothetical protein
MSPILSEVRNTRVVPSQVVAFIDDVFSCASTQQFHRLFASQVSFRLDGGQLVKMGPAAR